MTKKKDKEGGGTAPKSAKETTARLKTVGWMTVQCPTCKGSGMRGARKCGLCEGEKFIKVPKE
jgi:DnaJ-class molecular chaperone